MQLIDSHCHFDHPLFDPDRLAAWERARNAGVTALVVPAIRSREWPRQRRVCGELPGLHPAYGLHPMFMADHGAGDIRLLAEWIERERPVAVGECGLDFFIPEPDRAGQQRCFEAQLELARTFNLPVIIHARRAVEQVRNALRRYPGLRGVLHSFSGSLQQAEQLIEMGFLLGFGGPVTYPRASRLRRLVARLPLQAMLLETDAPDQPDREQRGQRNEPARLPVILAAIAGLRGETPEEIARITTRNARTLFALPPTEQSPPASGPVRVSRSWS